MPRKEKTNAKTWERDRRNRMNSYFKNLADLLPPQQEGKNRNKVDILIQASKYIKDLTNRTEELFHAHAVDAHKEELSRLKKLVAQLYSRTQLLSTLLKDAGITVPAEPALEKLSPLKWSNKINVEDADKYLDRFKERKTEKRRSKSIGIKVATKKKLNGGTNITTKKSASNNKEATENVDVPVEDRENHVNSSVNKNDESEDVNEAKDTEARLNSTPVSSNDCGTSEVAGPKSAAGIRKLESRKKIKRKKKQHDETTKEVTTSQSQSITNLMPGTIILSGGKIMPLVTPLTSNILVNATTAPANPIILGNNQANPMIVMQPLVNRLPNAMVPVCHQNVVKAVQKVTLNTVPSIHASVGLNSHDWVSNVKTIIAATKIGGRKGILPKGKEITKTTMAYKVPIPAVHRDVKVMKNSVSTVEKTDVKMKIKKIGKNKKSSNNSKEKDDTEKCEIKTNVEDSRKRKITNDQSDCSPTKQAKTLPETCKSIENLRQVVEKIGDNTDIPKNLDKEMEHESTETKSNDNNDNNDQSKDNGTMAESLEATKSEIPREEASPVKLENSLQKLIESPEIQQKEVTNSKAPSTILTIIKEPIASEESLPLSEVDKVIAEAKNDLVPRYDSLLPATETQVSEDTIIDSTKIILNLDTNTTTTMKPEINIVSEQTNPSNSSSTVTSTQATSKPEIKTKESTKSLSYNADNTFVPIGNRTEALHSDLSNDLFASLQVPSNSHNPESISPTAAFLMAFPLVSSLNGKTEVLEEDMKEDLKYHSNTPPMLLQIGTIEPNSFKVKSINSDKCERQDKVNVKSECQEVKTVSKALPKIINSEPFKERSYRIVAYVEPTKKNLELDTILSENCENRDKKINIKSDTCTAPINELSSRYTLPEYIPNYSSFPNSDNQLLLPIDNSRISHSSQVPTTQSSYSTRQNFIRTKDSQTIDTNQVSGTVTSLPVTSQSLQYYPSRTKDSYNPIQIAQNNDRIFADNQTKNDLHCTMSSHTSSYTMNSKESVTQMPYQDYSITQSKNTNATALDTTSTQLTRVYNPTRTNDTLSTNLNDKDRVTQNSYQGYSTQTNNKPSTIEQFDNIQRNYTTTKDTFVPTNTTDGQRIKLTNNIRSKVTSNQPETQTNSYSYDNKEPKIHTDTIFHGKRNETYIYPREQKKMFEMTNQPTVQINKTHVPSTSTLPRYPQQGIQHQQSCVATSNYGQTTVTENPAKSTTTVAHNSSNFSILSWTTFSPMNGGNNNNSNNNNNNSNNNNNNLVQFETANEHDVAEEKTICENFNYPNLHKDSVAFGNIMATDGYSVDKTKGKLNDNKSFDVGSKTKNIASMSQQKSNRNISDDYKFVGDKNKSKFPMDSTFTQTEFAGLDQRLATSKSHQISAGKTEKATYTIPNYDGQVTFDIPETVTPTKCTTDIYSGVNYKYPTDKNDTMKYQTVPQSQEPSIQNQQQNLNKTKPVIQQQVQQTVRPPVNWMTEIKHNTNISDLILPPIGKELEFCQNNIFSQASYNQNAPNQFYNNYDVAVSGAAHTFPNVTTLQSDPRRIADGYYNEEQQFSWSPSKNPQTTEHLQPMKSMDQQVVPSTLPTLVGDLALGTNIPEKQNFLFGQMPPRSTIDLTKTGGKDKEGRDFQAMLNTQTVQHTAQSGSFLSVSQLVEHEKEKTHQQAHHSHHVQQAQVQPQPRKHPRKGNTSPRTSSKRQMELRKTNELQQQQQHQQQQQQQQQHTEEQTYQQSVQQPAKYQQNDVLWRNRNCKSNYTAEALIGVNNNTIHDINNSDKQISTPAIKFSTDYAQNKFPGTLSTDMVMPPINYLTNPEDNGYGQVMNQNFNHSSYTYSPNANIYPTSNFIAGISNTPSSYMMPLHDNPSDYLEANAFLLSNVNNVTSTAKSVSLSTPAITRTTSTVVNVTTNAKNHQHYGNSSGKHHNCSDNKRNSYSVTKKSKRKTDPVMQTLDFPHTGGSTSMEDYHPPPPPLPPPPHHHHHPPPHHHHHHNHHASTFLPPPPPHANPLYQNHTVTLPANSNRRTASSTVNSVAMAHHPSGTSLTNFNLSTIFPEINDKVTGYKPPNALIQNHSVVSYPQRANYSTNNSLGHVPQVSEAAQFTTDLPSSPPSVLHYKAT